MRMLSTEARSDDTSEVGQHERAKERETPREEVVGSRNHDHRLRLLRASPRENGTEGDALVEFAMDQQRVRQVCRRVVPALALDVAVRQARQHDASGWIVLVRQRTRHEAEVAAQYARRNEWAARSRRNGAQTDAHSNRGNRRHHAG